jgi:hypothetical protein
VPAPAAAPQAEPAREAASTRPANEPEQKQETRQTAKPDVKPSARSEKEAAGEARRAKQSAGGEIEFANIPGLKGEEEDEAERDGRFADPGRPMRRTAPVNTSRAAREGTAGRGNPGKGNARQQEEAAQTAGSVGRVKSGPREERLHRAKSFNGDLRNLQRRRPKRFERPEREEPLPRPAVRPGAAPATKERAESAQAEAVVPSLPAPLPSASFDGLDFATWGAGHPPDTVGDVGPTYYIQSINSSVGIFRKSDGVRVAAFTLDTLMSQGNFGNLCDTDNFGDPVVLYDTFEDRWVITDFAFQLSSGNVVNPPGAFQCFAVSKTGDPVSGGWNFYSINTAGGLGDYPKFGIWPDGLYMTASIFGYAATAGFQNPRAYAFNKAQMYAGAPTVQVVSFDLPADDFTVLPSNARLQTGTPPPGSPNYYVSTWLFTNALSVYKFHVDWDRISLSTFTGPDTPLSPSAWPNQAVPNAPSLGGNSLDVLQIRAMMQNQYTNLGGVESLWDTHTVRRATGGFAAPRWYQLHVTSGTVAANITQAATFDPDGADLIYRFMPSLAVDRMGDMALGYSTSSSTTKPAIKYAGRLSTDPVNTFSQTEQLLIQGTGTQTGNCNGPCTRWGDYSAMSLDPDGCTFWYTNEYYAADGLNHQTRIGSFAFPGCTQVGAGGTVSGTVKDGSANPIVGATVTFGSRTATTDAAGAYSFTSIPAGTYPSITASSPGYNSSTATSVVVADGGTTTEDFALTAAASSACLVDTTQSDFQTGVGTSVDMTTSPGDVTLLSAPFVDQQNAAGTTTGTGFGTPAWTGQTFTPAATGTLVKADVQLFCNGCGATPPDLTLSVRSTSGGLPTGADLAATTIPGSTFASGATITFTASFGSPATLTAATQYALILRPVSAPSGSGYFWIRSSPSTYANGQRVLSANSGSTWSADSTRDYNFKTYMLTGFASSGNLVSGLKDANPAPGSVANWTTLSWTADTPANTSVSFQAAASNSASGPFNFVGPDGTAATFFTNGGSLAQFKGFRYLKYKTTLATTDNQVTPVVHDVTACFVDKQTQTISFGALADRAFGEDFNVSATATSGLAVSFSAAGDCTVTGDAVHLVGPGSCTITASQAGDGSYEPAPNVVQSFNITKGGTTTTLAPDINPSSTGQQVTLTATVSDSAASANPTGTVDFVDTSNSNTVICDDVSLTSSQAQCQTSSLAAGTHDIQAVYSGDGNFLTSTSNTLTQTVNPVLRVLDAKAAEPAAGSSQMLFTFVLTAPAGAGGVSVTYATADDTGGASPATAGTDYTPVAAAQLNFAPGETVKVVGVPVLHDADAGETDETFLLVASNPSGATFGRATAKGLITRAEAPGSLIISELRTRGPGGDEDDFVELYNNGNAPLTVSDPSGGYGLYKLGAGCNAAPVLVGVVPNATVIPARGHFLFAGAAYSLGSYAAGDAKLTSDIEDDRSVALFPTADVSEVSSANRLDAVGFAQAAGTTAPVAGASAPRKLRDHVSVLSSSGGMCELLKEGTALPDVAGTDKEHSFFRKQCDYVGGVGCTAGGNPKDAGDNAADFLYADTNPDMSGTQKLGAPGPENLNSPIRRDPQMSVLLPDRTVSNSEPPNRVRTFSDPDPNSTFGTLSIRRRVENNTGGDVTRLRFRVVELTTFPSPAGTADLRVRSSSDVSVSNVHDTTTCVDRTAGTASNCTISVKGALLEEPPNQASGGGYNSTLSVNLSGLAGGKLAAGQSVEVHFLLGIQQTGAFRFYIIVEALP